MTNYAVKTEECERLAHERDKARHDLRAAEDERDNLRLELAQERFMRASAETEVERLRAERDAARAEVARLSEFLDVTERSLRKTQDALLERTDVFTVLRKQLDAERAV